MSIKMLRNFIFVAAVFACASATNVRQCDSENPIDDLNNRIEISGCVKPPCRLKKDTHTVVAFRFTPDKDVKGLKNRVSADILGAKFPFVGVDGEDACSGVYNTDGSKLEKCDLKAGHDYVYKTKFEIFRIYPTLKTVVQWALVSSEGKDVICFETPIKIVN